MGQLIARRGTEINWVENRHVTEGGVKKPGIKSKLYLNPGKDPAMLRLVEYAPGYTEPRHSHTADEIVYIVSGEANIGGDVFQAGDTLWIGADTEYGPLTAGPNGATFILVRQKAAKYVPA